MTKTDGHAAKDHQAEQVQGQGIHGRRHSRPVILANCDADQIAHDEQQAHEEQGHRLASDNYVLEPRPIAPPSAGLA